MGFDLAEFHHKHRDEIIDEWINLLQSEVSENYARRPRGELMETVSGAFDADYHVMIHDDYSHINKFIDKIRSIFIKYDFV